MISPIALSPFSIRCSTHRYAPQRDAHWTTPLFWLQSGDMALISYNEVKPGVAVVVEGQPYVCTWNNIMKKQQRRPVNQTKLRHIIKGNSIEYSFQQSDKVEEAEIETRPAV